MGVSVMKRLHWFAVRGAVARASESPCTEELDKGIVARPTANRSNATEFARPFFRKWWSLAIAKLRRRRDVLPSLLPR